MSATRPGTTGEVRLRVEEDGRTPLTLVLDGPIVIGRDCEGLILADGRVSRRHVEFRPSPRGVEVSDLGSTNGTFLDDEPLTGSRVVPAGAVVRIGSTRVTIVQPETRVRPAATTMHSAVRASSIDNVAALASTSPMLVPDDGHRHGTITIVFSDIEGSTSRVASMGDTEWVRVLDLHNEVVRDAIRRFGGTEVKNQGDGFMMTFPSARRAVQAMVAAQRRLSGGALRTDTADLRIRVGMHTGEAIVDEDGDLFGQHVNLAARVAGAGTGGEILVSSLTRAILETRGDIEFGPSRAVEFKGLAGTHLIHPVEWGTAPATTDPEP
ncbi:MAG TPA: adenylate/guanylate cyclase domain-containing protein [Ilumatobacteraceae bacterium]|nr:adenylate/guanylate cyclase domain-containing protein [Ilumatobacteraceae bacterium]